MTAMDIDPIMNLNGTISRDTVRLKPINKTQDHFSLKYSPHLFDLACLQIESLDDDNKYPVQGYDVFRICPHCDGDYMYNEGPCLDTSFAKIFRSADKIIFSNINFIDSANNLIVYLPTFYLAIE